MLFWQSLARLIAAPMFTIFSVLSLAAGVAVTTAVYSVVDTLFLSGLGITDPDSVVFVTTETGGRGIGGAVSDLDFEHLRDSQTTLRSMSATTPIAPSVASTTNAEILAAEAVEGAYFSTLGIPARLGRLIVPSDHDAGAKAAVLSDEYWRARFAADENVIGRTIRIAGHPFEIVGVAGAGFKGALGWFRRTSVWIPLGAEPELATAASAPGATSRERRVVVFGRLAPHVPVEAVRAEVHAIAHRLDAQFPMAPDAGRLAGSRRSWSARLVRDVTEADTGLRPFGVTLVILVGMVLVVACTNLANLVLARGTARQGELAVRTALGASRGRLIREQCVESLILALVGAIAAYYMFIGVSTMMARDFTILAPPIGPLTLQIRPTLNAQALMVAAASMLLALAVFGLEPAVQLTRSLDIRTALAASATGVRPRVGRQRTVIRWQVAIAAGFFIVATMFIRATIQQARHDSGVELDRLAVATLNFQSGVWDEGRIRRTLDRVIEEARQEPNLESVSASTGLPFGVAPALRLAIAPPGDDVVGALARNRFAAIATTPAFFRTMGIAIIHGRAFDDRDSASSAPVVILSELTARLIFGTRDVVGRSVVLGSQGGGRLATVVGVARDTDVRSIYARRGPLLYAPMAQHFTPFITIAARVAGRGSDGVPALREAVRRADPDLAVDAVGDARSMLSGPFEMVRSSGVGVLYLAAFTLMLSMVGLYGVQSHAVTHRTREIGVRMSVGASSSQIRRMVISDGYRPVLEGLILGLWGGLAARVIVRNYLNLDVAIFDPAMLIVTPVPLVAAAFCACYLPAARASRIDPTVALRAE
jgi:putative ABC transport system permease protein